MKFLKGNLPDTSKNQYLTDNFKLIYTIKEKSFLYISLFIEVLIACIYAFGLGYSLSFFDNLFKTGIIFLILLGISYLIIIIPHEFLHVLFYKTKDNVTINYNLWQLRFISYFDGIISKRRALILISTPFIILSIIPTIISYLLGFNLFLYALASANAIKSGIDVLNLILIFINVPNNSNLIINENNIYFEINHKNSLEYIPSTTTTSNILNSDKSSSEICTNNELLPTNTKCELSNLKILNPNSRYLNRKFTITKKNKSI